MSFTLSNPELTAHLHDQPAVVHHTPPITRPTSPRQPDHPFGGPRRSLESVDATDVTAILHGFPVDRTGDPLWLFQGVLRTPTTIAAGALPDSDQAPTCDLLAGASMQSSARSSRLTVVTDA